MILVDDFVQLQVSPEFLALFLVVIQIGAILAVLTLYFHKLNPLSQRKSADEKLATWRLWGMVAIGCIPAAIVGILLDDWVNAHFYNKATVAAMLILYGVVFIVMERRNRRRLRRARAAVQNQALARVEQPPAARGRHARVQAPSRPAPAHACAADFGEATERGIFRIADVDDIDWKTALKIGCFQVLAIIPGTSRSGATIIGGMLCGCTQDGRGGVHVLPGHPHHVRVGPGEMRQVRRRGPCHDHHRGRWCSRWAWFRRSSCPWCPSSS